MQILSRAIRNWQPAARRKSISEPRHRQRSPRGVAGWFRAAIWTCEDHGPRAPGHTSESICQSPHQREESGQPWAVLNGDTLFIGDVGRPDLSPAHTPTEPAGLLHDSLHNKVMTPPDDVVVYPRDGGAPCGRNMRAERSWTIGTQWPTNHALQTPGRNHFIRKLASNLLACPEYFLQGCAGQPRRCGDAGGNCQIDQIEPTRGPDRIENGAVALDVRTGDEFATAHVPKPINIALSGQFATWAGTVLGLTVRPILTAKTDDRLHKAKGAPDEVGIDRDRRYLTGGITAWTQAGLETDSMSQMTVPELYGRQV